MKKAIVLLCALYLVLVCGAALAAAPTKPGGSTTLNDIPPAWSKTLQCDTTACPRFELVMGGAAVLDHETGLVWEQSPSKNPCGSAESHFRCNRSTTGGRLGWRVPTIQELTSLVDPTVPYPGPTLLAGHPFSNVQWTDAYWSASTSVSTITGDIVMIWAVGFADGTIGNGPFVMGKGPWVWMCAQWTRCKPSVI